MSYNCYFPYGLHAVLAKVCLRDLCRRRLPSYLESAVIAHH